jgi:hypothetical protein
MRLWRLALALLLAVSASAQKRASATFWSEQQKCERSVCRQSEDERKNCVAKCISPACFEENLGDDPLEDGQVDDARYQRFSTCVMHKSRIKDPSWDGLKNVSPEERELLDSRWKPVVRVA